MESDSTSSYSGSPYSDYSYSSGSYGAYSATGALGDTFSFNLDQAFSTLEESWKPSSFGNTGLGTIDLSGFGGATSPTSFNLLDSFSAPPALPAVIEFTPAPELAPVIPALPAVVAPQAVAAPDPVPSTTPAVDIPADLPVPAPQVISQALPVTPDSAPVASEPAPVEAEPLAQPVSAPNVAPAAPNVWADHYIETAVEEGAALPAAPLQPQTAQELVAEGISELPNAAADPAPVAVPVSADATATLPATGWEWYDEGLPTQSTGETGETRQTPPATNTEEFVGPPAPAANDKAAATPGSPTRTVIVGSEAKTGTVADIASKAGGVSLSAQIGQIIWANQMKNSTVHDGDPLSVTPATSDNYTEAQLKAFTRLGNAALAQDNTRLAAIRQAELAAEQSRMAQRAAEQRSTVTTVSSTPDGRGMMSLDEMAAVRARYSNGATVEPTLLDRTLKAANDGAGAVLQWMKENPRTMGVVQAAGGVAEMIASAGLVAGGTVTTATGVGAPVGVPLQALGWAGIVNGADNVSTGVQTAWNKAYQPTVTQQLAGATASALGASPDTVQKVEIVVGLGQAVLGAGATGQALALRPLPYTPVKPAAAPAAETSAVQVAETTTQQALKDVAAVQPQPVYFSTGTRIIPLEVDAAGNPTLVNRLTQYFDLQGRPTVSITELVDRVPTTNAAGRGQGLKDQSAIGRASGLELGEPSTGGHLAPRVIVGDEIGKSGIVGEPLRVQQQGSLIDKVITDMFAPPAGTGQSTGLPLSGRLVTTADYSITNRAFSPDVVTRDLTVLLRTPDLVSAATELPVARLKVVTDQLPIPGPISLAERPAVFTDLSALPAETGLTTVAASQLPLSARVARFDALQEANLKLNKTPEFIAGAYSPQGQINALKNLDNGSMMPSAAEISAMAERMNVAVTPEFTALAKDQRIQQIADIRVRIAETDIRNATNAAVPDPVKIQAAQDKLANATKLVEFLAKPKP